MKKIIWIYGQSATGKKTLINKLLNGNAKALEELDLQNKHIVACQNTIVDDKLVLPKIVDAFIYDDSKMQEDNEYFNRDNAKNRRACIMTDTLDFLQSSADVLLIKGQDNDIWTGRGDIVKYFLEKFANRDDLEIEGYILMVENDEIWQQRIASKQWFQKFSNKAEVMRNMLAERNSKKHERRVSEAFKDYNIPIYFIESGEEKYYFKTLNEIAKRRNN